MVGSKLNGRIFWIPAALLTLLLAWGFLIPVGFAKATSAGMAWALENTNWFLVSATFAAVIFCLWAAFTNAFPGSGISTCIWTQGSGNTGSWTQRKRPSLCIIWRKNSLK